MATVAIDMGDHIANVNIDGLENMSPDDQQAQVDEVKASMQATNASSPAPAATPPSDTSFTGAAGYGLHNAATGLGNTLDTVGTAVGLPSVASFGKTLEGATAAPKGYVPTDEAGALKQGNYGQFFHDLPRAATEGLAPTAAMLGAGALAPEGAATAGAVGLTAAALNLGNNVKAAAQNNGDAAPSTEDFVRGGLATAADAGLAAVGLGKIGPGRALLEAAPTLARPFVGAALDAGAGAATDAANQLATSAGTKNGPAFDPYAVANAGIQAGAARAASLIPELAAVGIKAGADSYMTSQAADPVNDAHAQAIVAADNAMKQAQAGAAAVKGDTSPFAAANAAKQTLTKDTLATVASLKQNGAIDAAQARQLSWIFSGPAATHNNTITDGLLQNIRSIGLPDDIVDGLVHNAQTLDVLSTQSIQKKGAGFFANVGGTVATGLAAAHAAMHGNMAELAAIGIGHRQVGGLGSAVGGALDNVFGTSQPALTYQANKARLMVGSAPVQDPTQINSNIRAAYAPGPAIKDTPPPASPDIDAAWNKATGGSYRAPNGDPWSASDQAKADLAKQKFYAGVPPVGAGSDPLADQLDREVGGKKGTDYFPQPGESPDLDNQSADFQANVQRIAASRAAFANRIANRKVDPDWLAQTSLNKAALSNQAKLTASLGAPVPNPAVSDTATDAAVHNAGAQAARIATQAAAPAEPTPPNVQGQIDAAWAANTPKPAKVPTGDPWASQDLTAAGAQQRAAEYLAGMALPGSGGDPLSKTPTLQPSGLPDASADLDGQAQAQQAKVLQIARTRQQLKNAEGARNANPTVLAQNLVDRAALSNQTKLTAGTTTPTANPLVSDTAVDATLNNAVKGARSIMAQASDGQADPITGVRPNLVPVNTPLDRNNNPLRAPQPAPAQPPAPTATPAPANVLNDPVAASVGIPQASSAPGLDTPAMTANKLEGYLANGNPAHTRGAVHAAIRAAFPDAATALIAHGEAGGGIDPAAAKLIQAKLNSKAPSGNTPEGNNGPVANPLAYQGAIENARATTMKQIDRVNASDLPPDVKTATANGLQDVLNTHASDPAANVAAKAAARDTHLNTIADAHHRAKAAKFFTARMMSHGPRHPKG